MIDALLVVLGACAGGPARFLVDRWVQERVARNHPRRIPWGILVVNVSGSLLMGIVVAEFTGPLRFLLGTGFCGAFTTFSTFAALSEESWRAGWRTTALANVAASVLLSCGVFWLAYRLTTAVIGA